MGTPEIIIILFKVLSSFILVVYGLVDITRSTFKDSANKIIRVLVPVLAPLIGPRANLIRLRQQKITTS